MGAMCLGWVCILVFGLTSLVAIGCLIARNPGAARRTFALGVLSVAILAAVATLSFLEHGNGYDPDTFEGRLMIWLAALTFCLAGIGQFLAARRTPTIYGVALGLAVCPMVLYVSKDIYSEGPDATRMGHPSHVASIALAAVALLLSSASMMVALQAQRILRRHENSAVKPLREAGMR
jgi:hypothetical protein